jgi:hypothetical protein
LNGVKSSISFYQYYLAQIEEEILFFKKEKIATESWK